MNEEYEDPIIRDAKEILINLVKKGNEFCPEYLDHMTKVLCMGLVLLIKSSVEKDNHKIFLQLIYNIIRKNILDE